MATWTDPRTWTDGELVTAAIMNPHVRDNLNVVGPVAYIRKAADEIVNNSVTLQNDDHFSFAIAANDVWLVQMNLTHTCASATPKIKFGWTLPAAASGHHWLVGFNTTTGLFTVARTAIGTPLAVGSGVAAEIAYSYYATIVNSTTAGTAQFQWAQNVATAADTILQQSSQMLAYSVS